MPSGGVPGTAVGLATAGGLLLYSGIKGVSIPVALRQVLSTGTLPAGAPGAAPGGSSDPGSVKAPTGSAIADTFLGYVGRVPYRWGGATPDGADCSGLVTYGLHHDLGYDLPDNTHTVCLQFYTWSGASKVSVPQAGDIVLWPTHMGVAVSPALMVSALNPRQGTVVTTFSDAVPGSAPTFLRVNTRSKNAGFN